MIVHQLKIWAVFLNPARYTGEQALCMPGVVTHDDACDDRRGVTVVVVDLSSGYVELSMQPREERFDPAALLFQRAAAWNMQFNGQCGDMHARSVARLVLGYKTSRCTL